MSVSAWVVRSGRAGERDQWAIDNGYSGGGWQEIPDLSACTTREEVGAIVSQVIPDGSKGLVQNTTAQLWALRGRITPGDLLAMPMKTTKQIALGRVKSGYKYLAEGIPSQRHVVEVDWIRTDVPRSAVKTDLLYTLGSVLTIFSPSKNNAVSRLQNLTKYGVDPGSVSPIQQSGLNSSSGPSSGPVDDTAVDSPELSTDFEQAAADQILTRIGEDFAGHDLATLITAVLESEGYSCVQSPPGPDGGIDITAGRGPLGLDSPRVLVQVKSGGQVGAPVVAQLQGVMATHGAEQGLLVAWGGLSKPARDSVKHQALRLRIWEASDIVDAVLRNYERLPASIQGALPLKRVWMLNDGSTSS